MAEADYSRVMETYKKLEEVGLKKQADSFMSKIEQKYPKGTSAPQKEIQQGLEKILAEHQETAPAASTGPFRTQYALGLTGILAAILLASAGMPYVPLY